MIDPDTLIQIAPDCPVDRGTIPEGKIKDDPIYVIQYELVAAEGYEEASLLQRARHSARGLLDGVRSLVTGA